MRLEIIYKLGFLIFLIFFYPFLFSDDVSAADINWAIQPGASANCVKSSIGSVGNCNNVRDNNNNTYFGADSLGGLSYTATVDFNQTAPIINKVEILWAAGTSISSMSSAVSWIDLYYQNGWQEVAVFGGFGWPQVLSSKTGNWPDVSAIRARVWAVNAFQGNNSIGHFTFELRAFGAETLSANLSALPASGPAPLTSTLTAMVSGSATGTINYTFYCNRNDAGINITTPYDAKFDGVSSTIQATTAPICTYNTTGTYYPKVIVERGGLAETDVKTVIVSVPVNNNPQITLTSVTANLPAGCGTASGTSLIPVLVWTYSDPDGDLQAKYQVVIKQGATIIDDSGQVVLSNNYYDVPSGKLNYNNTYDWTIQVWDSESGTSGPVSRTAFTTVLHDLPYPLFKYFPTTVVKDSNVQFCSVKEGACASQTFTETYCLGSTCTGWLWSGPGANPPFSFVSPTNSASKNPIITFSAGSDVSLRVTDSDGYYCSASQAITVGAELPLPIFKEK